MPQRAPSPRLNLHSKKGKPKTTYTEKVMWRWTQNPHLAKWLISIISECDLPLQWLITTMFGLLNEFLYCDASNISSGLNNSSFFLRNAQHQPAVHIVHTSIDREEKFGIKPKVIKWDIWLVALTHLQWWRKRSGEAAGPSASPAIPNIRTQYSYGKSWEPSSAKRWWWYRSWPGKFRSKYLARNCYCNILIILGCSDGSHDMFCNAKWKSLRER